MSEEKIQKKNEYYILIIHVCNHTESIYYETKRTTAKDAYDEFLKKMKECGVDVSFKMESADFYKITNERNGDTIHSVRTLISTFVIKDEEIIEKERTEVQKDEYVSVEEVRERIRKREMEEESRE